MEERIEDDYGDFLITKFEDIEQFIQPARDYLNYIISLINTFQNK